MSLHYLRGHLLLEQKRFAAAADEFRQAVGEDPEQARFYQSLAIALMHSDRWQDALKCAQTAVEKEPDSSVSHFTLAIIWLHRSMHKPAETALRTSIELDPAVAEPHGLLARIYCETHRPKEALTAAEAGLSLDPMNDLCLTFRARALIDLGRKAEAHDATEVLLQNDPMDAWNHYMRGNQLLLQGLPAEAKPHFLESLRLMPDNEAAREGLVFSLKARSPIFAFILGCLVKLGRIKPSTAWLIIGVGLLAFWKLNPIIANIPSMVVPYEIFKAAVYAAMVVLYIANPIFDTLLRFDREGRLALSDDEVSATNWYLAAFGLAILCGVWAWLAQKSSVPKSYAYAALFMCNPIREVFESTKGFVRKRMAAFTAVFGAGLVIVPLVSVGGLVLAILTGTKGALAPLVYLLIYVPVAAMLFSCFSDNLRDWLERRRPDE